MRVVVTGQVGLDKKPFLRRIVEIAAGEGRPIALCNVGERMYAEAPDVAAGRILDLPLSRLQSLRRSIFKDILALGENGTDVLVNTHATFRWRHGLFSAFDYDQMKALDADLYVVLVDNIDRIHYRLRRDGHTDHTLKDLMVWREEEIMATELLAQIFRGHGQFFICARGPEQDTSAAVALARLMLHSKLRKVYLSFPMSHVTDSPAVMTEIETFRREMKKHFICFDPCDVEEKPLCQLALTAAEQGHRTVSYGPPGLEAVMETNQILEILPDIDGQIYARDFKLIDQSDMILSLVPQLAGGRPAVSSGVERELQHAHEAAKEVFVIWKPKIAPSPFITETATRVFASSQQAVDFFLQNGYGPALSGGGLFA